jgi:hypothetical protein
VLSKSNHENVPDEPRPWLEEKVYARLRQRTVDLVKQSVDTLLKHKQRVSLATIVAKSKELDTDGKGISESAILDNEDARTYYEQHRSWQGSSKKRAKPIAVTPPPSLGAAKPARDKQRVRQRYLRMSKETLVERLLAEEQTYAEQRERWLKNQDEVLTWRLRAEAAEARMAQEAETSKRGTRTQTESTKKA